MDTEEANKFINSLVKNLQVLCHGHVSFDNSIQVIGHLYLNVDSNTNIDYIVNEKVCKSDNSSTMFVSKSYHSEPQKKEKKNVEKNQNRERRSSTQSDTSNDDQNQRNDRLGFSANYGDTHHPPPKTSTPAHGMRRPLHHGMEGSSMKMPRLSQPHSPMSPSSTGSRNSNHPGFRLDNRNMMGDNSSHQFDLSRLQQSNLSETSFHLQPHASSTNSQRNTSSTSSPSKTVVKQEPIQIDLSNVKSEPHDDDGGTEEIGGDMSNDEFLASLHDKTASIYPVGLHSNESSASSSQHLDFNLPISFQQGAGGAVPSFAPDGSAVTMNYGEGVDTNQDEANKWKQNFFVPRSRTFISRTEKRQLCLIHEAHPDYSIDTICKEFANKYGKVFRTATVYYIIKTKEKWLSDSPDIIVDSP